MAEIPVPLDGTSGEPSPEAPITAWHVFLVELILNLTDLCRVDVRDFVKLGTLPLEADVILLLKKQGEISAGFQGLMQPELDFLEPRLLDLTVVEYKSPKDLLDRDGVDAARVYGLLAKRKFRDRGILWDRQVCIMLLYSYAQRGLFDELAQDRMAFEEEEEGIQCHRGSMVIYAVNLVTLARRRPQNPLNLVSARHAQYSEAPGLDPTTLALVERIRYLINRRAKVRGMAIEKMQGFDEIVRDADEIRRRFLANLDPKERLDVVRGLGPKERLDGMSPKERLEGLSPKERLELLALLLAENT